jgi:hypothetical protein
VGERGRASRGQPAAKVTQREDLEPYPPSCKSCELEENRRRHGVGTATQRRRRYRPELLLAARRRMCQGERKASSRAAASLPPWHQEALGPRLARCPTAFASEGSSRSRCTQRAAGSRGHENPCPHLGSIPLPPTLVATTGFPPPWILDRSTSSFSEDMTETSHAARSRGMSRRAP